VKLTELTRVTPVDDVTLEVFIQNLFPYISYLQFDLLSVKPRQFSIHFSFKYVSL